MPKQIILGIDPGFARTGWGVIEVAGCKQRVLNYGCIETKAGMEFSDRLEILHNDLLRIIKKYQPDFVGIEQLFFCKNVTTALNVGQARGVVLLTLKLAKIAFMEFTPLQIKQAICGYGKADKSQIQKMVKTIFNLKQIPKPDDAADALAVAFCAAGCCKLLRLQK